MIQSFKSIAIAAALLLAGGVQSTALATGESTLERDRNYFTDLPLQDANGKTVRFYSDVLQGQRVLINFIYTSCEHTCPMLAERLKQVRASLSPSLRDSLRVVSITTDPKDTSADLREFANKAGLPEDHWVLLTGDSANLRQISTRLGQYVEDFRAHSTLLLAGDVPARNWSKIPGHLSPAAIAARIEALMEK